MPVTVSITLDGDPNDVVQSLRNLISPSATNRQSPTSPTNPTPPQPHKAHLPQRYNRFYPDEPDRATTPWNSEIAQAFLNQANPMTQRVIDVMRQRFPHGAAPEQLQAATGYTVRQLAGAASTAARILPVIQRKHRVNALQRPFFMDRRTHVYHLHAQFAQALGNAGPHTA